jgi:excisionase family DNA binding protein
LPKPARPALPVEPWTLPEALTALAYTRRKCFEEGQLPDEEYITVAAASKRSGLSMRHIARLLREGKIEGIKPGHDWLVRPAAVMEYLRQERKPGRRKGSRTGGD